MNESVQLLNGKIKDFEDNCKLEIKNQVQSSTTKLAEIINENTNGILMEFKTDFIQEMKNSLNEVNNLKNFLCKLMILMLNIFFSQSVLEHYKVSLKDNIEWNNLLFEVS